MTKIPKSLPSHVLQKSRVLDLSKTKAQNALLILMKCPAWTVQVIRSTLRISSKYLHLKKLKNPKKHLHLSQQIGYWKNYVSYNSWHGREPRYHLSPWLHFLVKETGSEGKVLCQGYRARSEIAREQHPRHLLQLACSPSNWYGRKESKGYSWSSLVWVQLLRTQQHKGTVCSTDNKTNLYIKWLSNHVIP